MIQEEKLRQKIYGILWNYGENRLFPHGEAVKAIAELMAEHHREWVNQVLTELQYAVEDVPAWERIVNIPSLIITDTNSK